MESGNSIRRRVRELLVERFPKCFMPKGDIKKPLAIGIREPILARCPDITEAEINIALRDYTRGNHTYRSQLFFGAERIGLDGEVTGYVSLEHAEAAGIALLEAGLPELAAAIAISVNRKAAA
jgi:sRNA-binding protein